MCYLQETRVKLGFVGWNADAGNCKIFGQVFESFPRAGAVHWLLETLTFLNYSGTSEGTEQFSTIPGTVLHAAYANKRAL